MSDRPYVVAFKVLQELSELPVEALAELRLDVLRRFDDDKPGVARGRVFLGMLLKDLIESDARWRGGRGDG